MRCINGRAGWNPGRLTPELQLSQGWYSGDGATVLPQVRAIRKEHEDPWAEPSCRPLLSVPAGSWEAGSDPGKVGHWGCSGQCWFPNWSSVPQYLSIVRCTCACDLSIDFVPSPLLPGFLSAGSRLHLSDKTWKFISSTNELKVKEKPDCLLPWAFVDRQLLNRSAHMGFWQLYRHSEFWSEIPLERDTEAPVRPLEKRVADGGGIQLFREKLVSLFHVKSQGYDIYLK